MISSDGNKAETVSTQSGELALSGCLSSSWKRPWNWALVPGQIRDRGGVLRVIAASSLIFLTNGFHLFVGPFVSVHLHHPLTEHIKRVFFVLLPVGTQPLPFRGSSHTDRLPDALPTGAQAVALLPAHLL